MRDYPTLQSNCLHYRNNSFSTKNRTSSHPLLVTRSASRDHPYHRTNPIHLTKTCPLRPNPASRRERSSVSPNSLSSLLNLSRRMRRTQPNSTTEDPSILFGRTLRMNDFSRPNSTPHNPFGTNHLHYDDDSSLPHPQQG